MNDIHKIQGYINHKPEKLTVGVAGLIIEADKVLLVKNANSGYWSFPGGHLRDNESIIEALNREVYEEAGLKINVKSGPTFYQYKIDDDQYVLLFFYLVERQDINITPKNTAEGIVDVKWFDISGLPEKIYTNSKTIIEYFTIGKHE